MAQHYGTTLAILLAFALMPLSSESLAEERSTEAVPVTTVLVRVQKLTGLNAENREQVLYASEAGAKVPLNDLAQVATLPDTKQGIPDGVYHDFTVELANEIQVHIAGRAPQFSQFRPGGPIVLRMTGNLVVTNGQVHSQGLVLAPERNPEVHGGAEQVNRDGHGHDDDDDD